MLPECCSQQGLSHDVGKVVVSRKVLKVNFAIFKGLPYVVVLYFDMLCSFVKYRVLNQLNSSLIVDMKSDRCIW